MEVVNDKAAMLSNYEVYKLLQETEEQCQQPENKALRKHQVNLATISYEARKYLEKTPCKYQNEEAIQEFLQALSRFNLTKAEKLQLLNLRPETPVEIQLIIEESEERLKTDDELQELLNVINNKLPSQGTEEKPAEEVGAGETAGTDSDEDMDDE